MPVQETDFVFLQEEVRKLRKRFEHMLSRAGGYIDGNLTVTGNFIGSLSGQIWRGSGGSDMAVDLNRPSVGGTLFVRNDQAGQAANLDVENDIVVGGLVDGVDIALFSAAPFLLAATDAVAPNHRVLTQDHAIIITDNGAGATMTVAVDETQLIPGSIPVDDRYFELAGETADANLFSGADLIGYSDAGTTKSFHLYGDLGQLDLLGRLRALSQPTLNFLALDDDAWLANTVFLMASNRLVLGIDSNNNSTTAEFIVGRDDTSPAGGNWQTLLNLNETGNLSILGNFSPGGLVDGVDIALFNAVPFVTMSNNANVPNERALVAGNGLGLADTGAGGNVELNVNVGVGIAISIDNVIHDTGDFGDVHTNYLQENVLTTKGDIYVATAASTVTRLGVSGNNGWVLTEDSAQPSGTKWANLPGSFSGFANPTALVGISAVNGLATTAMRSDAAPAIDQDLNPTWTATHTFAGFGLIRTGTDGMDFNPGGNIDMDLFTLGVTVSTGTPRIAWDQSEAAFHYYNSFINMDRGTGVRWYESGVVRSYILGLENIGEITGQNKVHIHAIKQVAGVTNQVEVTATAAAAEKGQVLLTAASGTDKAFFSLSNQTGGAGRLANFSSDTGAVKVGLNTDVPHGGIGMAMLALEGANASTSGPHIQITTATDDYPVVQLAPWQHDQIDLIWDAYYDGTNYRSSDVGSNFRLMKLSDAFQMQIATGFAAGSIVTWLAAFRMDTARNITLFSADSAGTSAQRVLVMRNGVAPTTSPANCIQLYALTGELFVRDAGGTVTPLSPHHPKLFTPEPDNPLPWVFHHENAGLGIRQEIDMIKLARLVEHLSGQQLIYTERI